MLQIRLLLLDIKIVARKKIALVINVLRLNQKLTLLILLKPIPIPIVTIVLIVAQYLPSTLTAIQTIFDAILVYAPLVDSSLNSNQYLYILIQKSDYYLSRQNYRLSCYLLSYYYIRVALQRLTNYETVMLAIASIYFTYSGTRIGDSLVIPDSAIQYLIPRCVFKLRIRPDFLLSLILTIKILYQKTFGQLSRHLIILRYAGY